MRLGVILAIASLVPLQAASPDDAISPSCSPPEAVVEASERCEPACEMLCRPRTYLVTEALLLQLHGVRNQPLAIDEDTGDTLLTTGECPCRMGAGMRLTLGIPLNDCTNMEASYFGLQHWAAQRTVVGDDNLSLPGEIPLATNDFFNADRMRFAYTADLHNVEVNLVRPLSVWDLSLLAGLRYIRLGERFDINSLDLDTGASDYDIRTKNDLYGAQIGARWQRQRGRFELAFAGKAGIFGSSAEQRTFLGDFDNTDVLRDSRTRGSRVAFAGELNLTCKIQLTSHLCALGGYNLLWLEGVARAPDQLDFTDTATSGTALVFGSAFMHGPNVGLEARW